MLISGSSHLHRVDPGTCHSWWFTPDGYCSVPFFLGLWDRILHAGKYCTLNDARSLFLFLRESDTVLMHSWSRQGIAHVLLCMFACQVTVHHTTYNDIVYFSVILYQIKLMMGTVFFLWTVQKYINPFRARGGSRICGKRGHPHHYTLKVTAIFTFSNSKIAQ
jgi:hypothetical protein